MDVRAFGRRAARLPRSLAAIVRDLLSTAVVLFAGLIVLILVAYFPLAATSVTLAITFAGLAGMIHILVAPTSISIRQIWAVAVTAAGALVLLLDLAFLLAGVISGITNSTTLDQSTQTILELAGLIFIVGYLSGFITGLLYNYSEFSIERRGVLRTYQSMFVLNEVRLPGWRERGR